MEVDHLIKVTLTNEILQRILEIDENRFSLRKIVEVNKLRVCISPAINASYCPDHCK